MTKANRSSNVFYICQSISNVALFDQHQKKTLECIKLFSSDIYDHNPSQIGPGVSRRPPDHLAHLSSALLLALFPSNNVKTTACDL